MIEEQQRIQMLTYALGLAIGALETIQITPYEFNKDGLEQILRRLKEMAEVPIFYVSIPEQKP